MDPSNRKKSVVLALVIAAALALPLALLLAGGWSMWRDYRARAATEAAHREAMRESLERAADVVMPVPTLSDDVVQLEVPATKFEQELQRVVRLAHGIGGGAASWNDGESVRIVANVPATAEDLFREAVKGNVVSITAAGDSATKTVVQIILRPSGQP